jgi:Matrixin
VSIRHVTTALVAGGLALVAAGMALYGTAARAASPREREAPAFQYTSHVARQAAQPRLIPLMIDRDFDEVERQRIVAAIRQWNYVLNGFVRFEAKLLPDDPAREELARVRHNGGWVVARVDSRHPVARKGEGANALAVTVTGGRNGGFAYVIADRIGGRDLTGVVMHEFGHVLGADHDDSGLMAPVYSASGARCIDYMAVSLVARAQHLPIRDLNWCETPRYDPRYQPRTARNGWQ